MKRFLVVFALVAVIVGVLFYFMPKDIADYAKNFTDVKCFVYCRDTSLPCENVGYGRIVECSSEDLLNTLNECCGVDGVSFTFSATEKEFEEIVKKLALANAAVMKTDGVTVVSGFSPKLRGGVIADGKKINAQAAYADGIVSIGSPLILGSY